MFTAIFFENETALGLSRWAKKNPLKTRAFITIGHFLAFFACFWIGKGFFDLGLEFSRVLFFGLGALSVAVFSAYPFRKKDATARAFRLERGPFDALLIVLFLGLAAVAGNVATRDFRAEKGALGARFSIEKDQAAGLAFSIIDQKKAAPQVENAFLKKAKRLIQPPRFVQKIQRFVVEKTEPSGGRSPYAGILLFLTIVAVIALEWVLLFVSCSLSCNGMGMLAALVAVGGLIGLFLGVWAICLRLFRSMSKGWNAWLATAIVLGPVVLSVLLSFLGQLFRG